MPERTLLVCGPGGVGKSPLDALVGCDVVRVDPYRLRAEENPRNAGDHLYAHPKLRCELHRVLTASGERVVTIEGDVEWFPKSQTVFFRVREDWQLLFLGDLTGKSAKAELYAPILPVLLSIDEVRERLGHIDTVVLNPAPDSICAMSKSKCWTALQMKTEWNCSQRGDSVKSVCDRVASAAREAPAYARLITDCSATEYVGWGFPEYAYQDRHKTDPGVDLLTHQQQTLIGARSCLLSKNPNLARFVKSEDGIRRISAPFVK